MQSKRLRKKGLQSKKKYNTGGTVGCPNPPCPPGYDNRVQTLLASGMWEQGPNGELLRRSPEELNQQAFEKASKEAMGQLAVEDPATFAPTTSGFMTPERKTYLETRAGKLTPEEAREYGTVSFDPFEGPNIAFGFAAGAFPADPIGLIIGQGLGRLAKGYKALKNPRVMPVMEEARMEASIQGLRDRFNIGTGHVVDGKTMNPQLLREMAIKDLIGESTDAGRIARANQLIDKAIEDAMPQAIETVMRRSEGNLLDIPVDTRRPEVDRVRMRFLGPNSKLWQQANKDGFIPVNQLAQMSNSMSDLEKSVFEGALARVPIYDKKGQLLTGKELNKASNDIMNTYMQLKGGNASATFDPRYRINLNQLKGLTETTYDNVNPIRTIEIAEGQEDLFGSKIDQVRKSEGRSLFTPESERPFSGSDYSDYGLGRIGYGSLDSESSKTWAIGSDVIRSNTNHFGRGELAHFRTFVNDAPTTLAHNIPGTEITFMGASSGLRSGTSISGSGPGAGGGRIEWYPDMSKVPSGLGITGRGGTLNFFDGGPARMLEDAISSDLVRSEPVSYLSEMNGFNNSMARSQNETRRIMTSINSIQVRGGTLIENDFKIKNLYDFASDPNRRAAVDALLIHDSTKRLINSNFDQLINFGKLEEAAMGSLKANTNLIAPPTKNLAPLQVFKGSRNLLDVMAFDRHGDGNYFHKINQANYEDIRERAEGDFSFGSWSTASGDQDLAYLLNKNNEHTLPRLRQQAMDLFDDQKKALLKIIEDTPGLSGVDADISQTFNSVSSQGVKKISDLRGRSSNIFDEMERYSSEAEDIAYELSEAYNNTLGNLRRELGEGNAMFGGGAAFQQQLKNQAVVRVQELFPKKFANLKQAILNMEMARVQGDQTMQAAYREMLEISDDLLSRMPRLAEVSQNAEKEYVDKLLQSPMANDYYDIVESQNEVRFFANNILKDEQGAMKIPGLFERVNNTPDKGKFFVSEIQSDYVQRANMSKLKDKSVINAYTRGSQEDDLGNRLTAKGVEPQLDSFTKNWRTKTIQQAVLKGREAGKNEILFPTYKTADRIQNWQGSKNEGVVGSGNRITYQGMDKHIQKATGIKPTKYTDEKGNEWWMIKMDPNQKYEFPDFKYGGKIRLKKK